MASKRRVADVGDPDEQVAVPLTECTTLDHIYPDTKPNTRCYCGKKLYRPFIALDDVLKPGMYIRTYMGGPIYEVEMVNQSRARCRLVTAQAIMTRRSKDKVFMPIPGSEVEIPDSTDEEDEERRGRIINISPRSAAIRVSAAEVEQEALVNRSKQMASKQMASIPVAGKSSKEREQERRAKLAAKPNGAAKPLYGAAAKAASRPRREKAPKTVRACGCGCGGETMGYFVPGHDARYKGWMKKLASGEIDQSELKKLMGQKVYGRYSFKKTSTGFAPKESYQEAAG